MLDKFQLLELTELMLCFHAFLKYGSAMLSNSASIAAYNKNFCYMMTLLRDGICRDDASMQFKLQKFLECSHFLRDHLFRGPPTAHNTDTGERGLKKWAKSPARTAQNRGDQTFKRQVAMNQHQSNLINWIVSSPITTNCNTTSAFASNRKRDVVILGNVYVYMFWSPNEHGFFKREATGKTNPGPPIKHLFPRAVADWFVSHFLAWYEDNRETLPNQRLIVRIHNEIKIDSADTDESSDTSIQLRAHPNFRGEGPWYDYLTIAYQFDGNSLEQSYPARCACIFSVPTEMPSELLSCIAEPDEDNTVFLLIQECYYPNHPMAQSRPNTSRISSLWTLQSKQAAQSCNDHIADLSCITHTCISSGAFCVDMIPLQVTRLPVTTAVTNNCNRPSSSKGDPFYREKIGLIPRSNRFDILLVKDRQTAWSSNFLDQM